jgi:hypothetical protein
MQIHTFVTAHQALALLASSVLSAIPTRNGQALSSVRAIERRTTPRRDFGNLWSLTQLDEIQRAQQPKSPTPLEEISRPEALAALPKRALKFAQLVSNSS